MNKQNLKVDDYYYAEYSHTTMPGFCIVKGTRNINRPNLYTEDKQFYMKNNCMASQNIRLATPEEKHWLDKCIELNKFITKEEAMKSFIPEYVKCTNVLTLTDSNSWTLNKIYKTVPKESVDFPIKLMIINNNGEKLNVNKWNTDINYYFSFKPSTKEEFEAQNKPVETMKKVTTTIDKLRHDGNIDIPKGTTFEVIEEFENSYQVLKPTGYNIRDKYLFLHKSYFEPQEPEFVLPEYWYIKPSFEQFQKVLKWAINKSKNNYNYYQWSPYVSFNDSGIYRLENNRTEISFEQWKKYVLKEEELKQPAKDASIEEILEYCKKKYPVGTKVKSKIKNSISTFTITGIPDRQYYTTTSKIIVSHITGYFCLYNNTMGYAEIVEESKQEFPFLAEVKTDSKTYSLEEISKVINANYEKEDALEIIKTIKSIK